jgi:hypothetical protein
MNKQFEQSVTSSKLYADLSLNVPPTKNVIEKYRKSLVVPSGEVEKERALEKRRKLEERMDSYLQKVAEKQGIASPDRVYKGPGKY